LAWLQGEGNYARYASGEAGIKMACSREISALLLERGIVVTAKNVQRILQSKITKLEKARGPGNPVSALVNPPISNSATQAGNVNVHAG
jgi:hypothetical protein